MEPISLIINMPFSWWRGFDPDKNEKLIKPEKVLLAKYMDALFHEMKSLGEDFTDRQVDCIHFSGGYMGLLMPDDFNAFMCAVRRSFNVAEKPEISGTLFPGSVDMALLSAYSNESASPVMFEVPSLLMRECEIKNLPNVMQLMDHTKYLMEAYRYSGWGISLAKGIDGRDKGKWEHNIMELLRYEPTFISFFRAYQMTGEEKGLDEAIKLLIRAGYKQVAHNFYSLNGNTPQYLDETREFIAVGLGAESKCDGFYTKNTSDMQNYLLCCHDYRNLIVEVREIQ